MKPHADLCTESNILEIFRKTLKAVRIKTLYAANKKVFRCISVRGERLAGLPNTRPIVFA